MISSDLTIYILWEKETEARGNLRNIAIVRQIGITVIVMMLTLSMGSQTLLQNTVSIEKVNAAEAH